MDAAAWLMVHPAPSKPTASIRSSSGGRLHVNGDDVAAARVAAGHADVRILERGLVARPLEVVQEDRDARLPVHR